ncbi:MAG: nitrogenase component 1 [Stutzerimonas stutzeri]
MNFTSDFQEKDIVFGGDKKLAKLIDEIETLFPLNKGISVQSECPIGLIGDDIEAVSPRRSPPSTKPPWYRCAAKVSAACRSPSATT